MPKVENSPENSNDCICPECKTWLSNPCAKEKNEKLYCATGKSVCDLTDKGCICGMCPIWDNTAYPMAISV